MREGTDRSSVSLPRRRHLNVSEALAPLQGRIRLLTRLLVAAQARGGGVVALGEPVAGDVDAAVGARGQRRQALWPAAVLVGDEAVVGHRRILLADVQRLEVQVLD